MSTIKILIVDDHPVVREGLRGMLSQVEGFEIVGEARSGREAIAVCSEKAPDVVLMDLRMEDGDGVEATRVLRREHPNTQVLILTTFDTDADILPAIEAGATGYLLKDCARDELIRAIQSAARREAVLSPSVAARVMGRMRQPTDERLSRRELEVLTQLAKGLSNGEIAKALCISEATVKTHLLHIYRKLDVDDRTAAVTTGIQRGLISL